MPSRSPSQTQDLPFFVVATIWCARGAWPWRGGPHAPDTFAANASPLPEPPEEPEIEEAPGAVELAVGLIAKLAEDPLVPGSYRLAARRHLKRLKDQDVDAVLAKVRDAGGRLGA